MKNNRRNRKKVIIHISNFSNTGNAKAWIAALGLSLSNHKITHAQAAGLIKMNPRRDPILRPMSLLLGLKLPTDTKGPATITGTGGEYTPDLSDFYTPGSLLKSKLKNPSD